MKKVILVLLFAMGFYGVRAMRCALHWGDYPMGEYDIAQTYTFREQTLVGAFEGTVIFKESK